MKRLLTFPVLAALLALAPAPAFSPEAEGLLKALGGSGGEAIPTADLPAAYEFLLDELLPGFAAEDPRVQGAAQQAWHKVCVRAGRPDAEAERLAACRAMAARLRTDLPVAAKVWLLKQLQQIGRAEAVEAIDALLGDADRVLASQALLALQNLPGDEAGAALRRQLQATRDPAAQLGLVQALAYRRDAAAAPLIAPLAVAGGPVDAIALRALGRLADPAALAALEKQIGQGDPTRQALVADAALRCADRLLASGDRAAAEKLYARFLTAAEPTRIRVAAFRGLALAKPAAAAAEMLLGQLFDDDRDLTSLARRLVVEAPTEGLTAALAKGLEARDAEARAAVLPLLAERGDRAALPLCLKLLSDGEATVRLAAVNALAHLGDATAILPLTNLAATAPADLQTAARAALAALRAEGVDAALSQQITGASEAVRSELVRALMARRSTAAVPHLLQLAAASDDAPLRAAAYEALAKLAPPAMAPDLARLVIAPRAAADRPAAEQALTATILKETNPDQRAAPLLAALVTATGEGRAGLLRCLGVTGADSALKQLTDIVAGTDEAARVAALEAFRAWPDARPLATVREAANGVGEVKRAALEAYAHLLTVADQPADALVAEYAAALARADSPAARTALLLGLGRIPSAKGLALALPLLPDPAAARCILGLAEATILFDRQASAAALQAIQEQVADQSLREQAGRLLELIGRFGDYLTDWLFDGPYFERNKNYATLFYQAFAPEQPEGKPNWQRLKTEIDPNQPFRINLDKSDWRGNERIGYATTRVWVPAAMEVEARLGSDDGIRMWLNGAEVHDNATNRGHAPEQDRFKVKLNQGWNEVLLKIGQGGGEWAFSLRFVTLEGQPVAGLRADALGR